MHPVDTLLLLNNQTAVNARMRSILVEWLWEVCKSFKLHAATFFRSVNYVEQFLYRAPQLVERSKLQLLGIGALFVASKIEELYSPEVKDYAFVCDKAYTASELIAMETTLVSVLHWNLQNTVITTTTTIDEYAAVLMTIDGGIALTPMNRRIRAGVRRISKRLRAPLIATTAKTRSKVVYHDPLTILSNTTVQLDMIRRFYDSGARLAWDPT